MICKNCKTEIDDNFAFCPSCGQANDTTDSIIVSEGKDASVTAIKKKTREKVDVLGISIPILFISLFGLVLGFGGYVTPLFLMAILLLSCGINNKTLTGNIIVTLVLYASQFVIDTALTFLESIPNNFFTWLMEIGNLEFSVIIGKIATAFANFFSVCDSIVGIGFLALYILSIISLFKSDKINIPIISNLCKKIIKED